MIPIIPSLLLTTSVLLARAAPEFPFQDPTLPWDQRAEDLVGRLTLEEIWPQTMDMIGKVSPAIPRLGIKPYVWDTECIRGQDGTNTTAYPQSIGLSASFSKELLFNISEAISYEVRAHWNAYRAQGLYKVMNGLSCFSPVINIMRHPLWGRNQETYGEDPFLSGALVQGFVTGLQGSHPRYVRVNAGCKHFDVHGGPENIPVSRFSFNAKVSERDWRMTFLPQFKMCVDAGSYSLMCSFNSINGVPACANAELMTNITRREWGFKGYIVSDDGAIQYVISKYHYVKTRAQAVAACIHAGCNMELTEASGAVYKSQVDAVKQGLLSEAEVRQNVKPLFYTRLRLGEFDPPEMVPYNKITTAEVQSAAHRELATRAATMSFVLLKNDKNLLPLTKKPKQVALVGPFANATDQLYGDYASNVLSKYLTTVQDGIGLLGGNVSMATGCHDAACKNYRGSSVMAAVKDADIVFVALGTGQALESEGNDRADIYLAGNQLTVLQDAVAGSNAPVVLLLFNAGPLDITMAKYNPRVTAILECFFPAQSAGDALYRVLTATGPDSVPAGRLSATWPTNINQVPPITDYTMKGRTYRYYQGNPLYPFGYGLSYTTFFYTSLTASTGHITAGMDITFTIGVRNTGRYDADEVIQLYLVWPSSPVPVPRLQLVGFTREHLRTGQHRVLDLLVKAERLAVWMDDHKWGFIKGEYTVYGGGQQPNQNTNVPSNVLQTHFTIQ